MCVCLSGARFCVRSFSLACNRLSVLKHFPFYFLHLFFLLVYRSRRKGRNQPNKIIIMELAISNKKKPTRTHIYIDIHCSPTKANRTVKPKSIYITFWSYFFPLHPINSGIRFEYTFWILFLLLLYLVNIYVLWHFIFLFG